MGKRVVFATILLFLIVADVASATPFLWNFRKLISSPPKEKPDGTVSPNPSPSPLSPDESSKGKTGKKTPAPEPANYGEGEKKKDEQKVNKPSSGSSETCDLTKVYNCKDSLSMVACIQAVDEVNKVLVVLIQNEGDNNLKVNIRTASVKKLKEGIEVPEHHSQKINITLDDVATPILLNAGKGDCTLQAPVHLANEDLFQWIPSYSELMTPMYGAYFLILVTIVALGVFACCKLRNRRRDEITYQELEMGGTGETTSVDVETADGWDEGWDDDWGDDKAVKPPHPGSVSSNGLVSRSPNRDGWEDWDD